MTRKLFIVARGNTAVYRQLQLTVGREADVEIIYDRRPVRRKPGRLGRLVAPLKRLVAGGDKAILERLDRRQQAKIDEELSKKGWVVIRIEDPTPRTSKASGEPRGRLVVEPGATRLKTPAPAPKPAGRESLRDPSEAVERLDDKEKSIS